jgi:hypothetical protein
MVANRGLGNQIDWVARSKKAKAKYYKEASRKRYEKSEYRKWIILAKQCLANDEKSSWQRRCQSASSLLSKRMNPSVNKKAFSKNIEWERSSKEAFKRLNAKAKRSSKCSWTKRVTLIAGVLKRRRDLRNAKSNTLQHTDG